MDLELIISDGTTIPTKVALNIASCVGHTCHMVTHNVSESLQA